MKSVKTFLSLFLSGVLIFAVSSCKKYDEGGTLYTANKKIVNIWKVEYAIDLEDGSNITSDFKGELWEFTKNYEYRKNGEIKGTYTFSENKFTLIILKTGGGSDTYNILKLTSASMWLEEIGSEEIHLVSYN